MQEFSKKYDHKIEDEIYKYWLENNLFDVDKKKSKDKFVISMPPPNVTWVLHIGHALMLAIEDALIRHARMNWKQALWIPWTDHAWISTQVVVEKRLLKEHKISRHDLGREKFLERVWDWVKYSRSTIVSQVKKMWASCDWSREQFTLSEKLSRAVRKSFSNLSKSWKIYRGAYIVNWCPRCQTVLSDIEVKYQDTKSKLYYIRYFIEWKWDSITVATVRPETIFWDVAIAVNPKDKRYKKLVWKKVLIPIVNRPIPIIADENVDVLFGTWALKITPTHDIADFEIWKKHNLPLDSFAIDKDWNLTKLAWDFAWKKVEEVYENILQYLMEIWNLEKVVEYDNSIPNCERCGTRIQPMVSNQWFVDVNQAAAKSIEYVNNKQTTIIPERFNKTFFQWLEDIKPWCISRQLRWGHRIPVWHCESGHINILDEDSAVFWEEPKSKKTKQPAKNSILSLMIFNLIADNRLTNPFNLEELINILCDSSLTPQEWNIYKVYCSIYKEKFKDNDTLLEEIKILEKIFWSFEKSSSQIVKQWWDLIDILDNCAKIDKKWDKYKFQFVCAECWSWDMKQDEDVLDTWFSSALWPFSILGWPENTQDLQDYYPNNVLETWYDIIFHWVARMMMMWEVNTSQTPFHDIYLHWLVRDEKWEKMSKSKWNVVDPLVLIDKYWADALRLSLIVWSTPWNDLKFSETKVDYSRRFLNKLWNATRYINMKIIGDQEPVKLDYDYLKSDIEKNIKKLNEFDKWMLNKINELIEISDQYMWKFMLWELGQTAINIAWHDLCDWYIEISKLERSNYTDKVLLYSVATLLKILHPFIPFITEKLWMLLNFEDTLICSDYPKTLEIWNKNHKINILMDIITEFRILRQQWDYKPHETVDLFIQWNSVFIDFAKWYVKLLKTILKADNVYYFEMNEKISDDYSVSVVMDLKIWLKWLKKIDWNDKLKDLENQVEQEKQYLQNIRTILTNPWFVNQAPPKIVEERRKTMEEIKSRITTIEHEINRIKMEKK